MWKPDVHKCSINPNLQNDKTAPHRESLTPKRNGSTVPHFNFAICAKISAFILLKCCQFAKQQIRFLAWALGLETVQLENVPPKHPIASLLLVSPLGDVQQSLGLIQTNIHQTKKIKKNSSHHHITWNHLATSRATKHLARALRLHRP